MELSASRDVLGFHKIAMYRACGFASHVSMGKLKIYGRSPKVRGYLSRGFPLAAMRDYELFLLFQNTEGNCPTYFKNQKRIGCYYTDFKTRKVIRDKEGYYLMIKECILQEDTAILTVYTPNSRATNCVRQKLTARRNRQIHYQSWRFQ